MKRLTLFGSSLALAIALIVLTGGVAQAYEQYTENTDATNCGQCHGANFRDGNYVSQTDGQNWGNLHNIHRSDMLNSDCDACHQPSGRFPVYLDLSTGGDGLSPISCMGCHGRLEDENVNNPNSGGGKGAGLRQHHFRAGETICLDCHDDSDPANYTPVGEDVLPDYYANPGNNHPAMPTVSCNEDGSEDFAGASEGLDNDGDDSYDGADTGDCGANVVEASTWGSIKSLYQ